MRNGNGLPAAGWRVACLALAFGLFGTAGWACSNTSHAHGPTQDGHEAEHADEHASENDHEDEHGHGHGQADLDRPVETLFGASCEHGVKAFACPDCRYEVGVVRAPEDLVDEGLFEVVRPSEQTVADAVELTGEVRFDERRVAHVTPAAEGIVRKVHAKAGDEVEKGQPLVEIESVRAGDAHGELLEARARLQLAESAFERSEALKAKGLTSDKDYQEAKTEVESARIRVRAARDRLQRLGGAGGAGTIVLRAPIEGTLLLLHAVPGEFVSTEDSLATVGDNRAVWVWADLYERDIARVMSARGAGDLAASVHVRAYPGEAFPGAVDFVSPAMDRDSRTVKARILVDNADGRLLAGMFADVEVFLPGRDRALALPSEAVMHDEGRSFVFVHHHEDYYVRRPVKVGRSWAQWVEIESGVEAGQTVVARGAFLMKSDVLRSKMGAGCAD